MTRLLVIVGVIGAILGIYLAFGNKFLQKSQSQKYTGPVEKIVIANQREYSIFNYIAKEQQIKGWDTKARIMFTAKGNISY